MSRFAHPAKNSEKTGPDDLFAKRIANENENDYHSQHVVRVASGTHGFYLQQTIFQQLHGS
jgi:hypothetical protein